MEKNQRNGATDFDEPRSLTNPQNARSGRLKIIWFSPEPDLGNKFDSSKQGGLGYSLYTCRVKGIENYQGKIKVRRAKNTTEIQKNEFGEKSFSFAAPDGYFWTIIE